MANSNNDRSLESKKAWEKMSSPDNKPSGGNDKKMGDDTTKDPRPKQ